MRTSTARDRRKAGPRPSQSPSQSRPAARAAAATQPAGRHRLRPSRRDARSLSCRDLFAGGVRVYRIRVSGPRTQGRGGGGPADPAAARRSMRRTRAGGWFRGLEKGEVAVTATGADGSVMDATDGSSRPQRIPGSSGGCRLVYGVRKERAGGRGGAVAGGSISRRRPRASLTSGEPI